MEKTLFEQMGGPYTRIGDYYLPALALPPEEEKPIDIWGQRHLQYLKEYKHILSALHNADISIYEDSMQTLIYKDIQKALKVIQKS